MGKVIGVISLKGGVGKTSVVAALGGAFSEIGKKVLLVDGNLSSPSLGLHLGIVDPQRTLHHVLNRTARLKDAIYKCGNLDVMPASIFERAKTSPLGLKDKINGLKRNYDIILIDSSPSLDEETLAVILASDQVITVTTPDHPTLSATMKAVKLAKQRGVPISGIVLNKVHDKDFEISLERVEEALDVPVLAVIPYDVNALKALSNMEPSTTYSPKSKGSIEYKKLASVLVGEKYDEGSFNFRNFFGMDPKREEVNREIFYNRIFSE
jgi:septum site-determining protein MinD